MFKRLKVCLRGVENVKEAWQEVVGGICRNQITSSLLCHVRSLDFIECTGKPWEGFMQRSGMVWFTNYKVIN